MVQYSVFDCAQVYEQVSSAYSILHLRRTQNKDGTESVVTSVDGENEITDILWFNYHL
jgi:hypothetical protein